MTRLITTIAIVAVSSLAATFGYRMLRADAVEDIYRERLETLAQAHDQLAERYNRAVKATAVTELLVTPDAVAVRVRTAAGTIQTIPTPFSPAGEIYVDYAVKDGRLLIRRVFDQRTAPERAVVIDPALAELDWSSDTLRLGKAVYRGGLTPGVWTIAVSGSGALSLEKTDTPADLAAAPPIETFEEVQIELDRDINAVTLADVWARLFGR